MKKYIASTVVALLCTVGVFVFHYAFPSMLNQFNTTISLASGRLDNQFLTDIIRYHETQPAFAARPFTTDLIRVVHYLTGLPNGWAFTLVNFMLLWFAGVALYALAIAWGSSIRNARISIVCFYLSFTVLFGFFASIYSYDEPLQYLCIFLALLFFTRGRRLPGALLFGVAALVRETTFFLLPSVIFFFSSSQSVIQVTTWRERLAKYLPKFGWLVIPIALYASFQIILQPYLGIAESNAAYLEHDRFAHAHLNFQTFQYGLESFVSLGLALGLPLAVTILGRRGQKGRGAFFGAAFLAIIINTPIVLISAYAREARLFALPLIFLWPMVGDQFETLYRDSRRALRDLRQRPLLASVYGVVLVVTGIAFAWLVGRYIPTASGYFDVGYRTYLFVTLFLPTALSTLRRFGSIIPPTSRTP